MESQRLAVLLSIPTSLASELIFNNSPVRAAKAVMKLLNAIASPTLASCRTSRSI